jgi:PAS domain-containing protein
MAHDNLSPESAEPLDEGGFSDVVENSRIIAETASDAIITIDEESNILFVNHAAVRIFGYSPEEMLGGQLTMLMPEYLRHLHRAGLKQYVETGNKHISWDAAELPGLHYRLENFAGRVSAFLQGSHETSQSESGTNAGWRYSMRQHEFSRMLSHWLRPRPKFWKKSASC